MNHLESSFTGKNAFWRYSVMVIAIFAATNTIGSIPLIISMIAHPESVTKLAENPTDLSVLCIDPILGLVALLFPFIIGLGAFILLVKPLNLRSFMAVINGTNSFRWNRFFISAIVWAAISALYLFISLKLDPGNFTLNNTSKTLIPLIIISVLLVPFQASFEEVLFRGYLMQGFSVIIRNRFFPLIMTSLLFGLMHGLNPEIKEFGFWTMMPQYITFGIIFGVMTILDDGIESAMGAHSANNAFLCIMVTTKSSALQTPAVFQQHNIQPWIEFISMLMMGVLIIVILKLIFRWKSFSTLFSAISPEKQEIQIL